MSALAWPTTPSAPPARPARVNILQGQQYVSASPTVMVSTLLGSCVAACLYDPERGVGGMNHFLLPGETRRSGGGTAPLGVHAMELLVNAVMGLGARRDSLHCKLFGGAHLLDGLADVGRQNSDFALAFLQAEGIRYAGGSLGGSQARRVQFWPGCGRARQLLSAFDGEAVFAEEMRRAPLAAETDRASGDVELF